MTNLAPPVTSWQGGVHSMEFRGFRSVLLKDPMTGHARYAPMPTPEILEKHYGGEFQLRPGKVSVATEFTPQILDIMRGVVAHLSQFGLPEKGRFHDVGCGFGAAVWGMQQLGYDASGNDMNADFFKVANQHCMNKLYLGMLEDIAPKLSKIDVFFCTHVLEHLIDPLSALSTMAQKLNRGGLAYLCVPNGACHHVRKQGFHEWVHHMFPAHLHCFTPDSLVNMVKMAMLDVVSVETRPNYELPLEDGETMEARCARLEGGELFVLARKP